MTTFHPAKEPPLAESIANKAAEVKVLEKYL